jgi:hypothetical protein
MPCEERAALFGWPGRIVNSTTPGYWATSANPISCAGTLAKVVLQDAHARLGPPRHGGAFSNLGSSEMT